MNADKVLNNSVTRSLRGALQPLLVLAVLVGLAVPAEGRTHRGSDHATALAGGGCSAAKANLNRTRAALSAAVREANAAAASLRVCMERSRNVRARCAAQQKAFEKANRHLRDMKAAYRFARDKAKVACRR